MSAQMSKLELKKLKAELLQVSAAKAQMEVRLEETLESIQRIKENMAIQEAKEIELQDKIKEAEK